jgi:hypothetical protein
MENNIGGIISFIACRRSSNRSSSKAKQQKQEGGNDIRFLEKCEAIY